MPDKKLICKDCGAEFFFTEGEQVFYREKGFSNEPQRCPGCRKRRKEQGGGRGTYGAGNPSGGNRSFGRNTREKL